MSVDKTRLIEAAAMEPTEELLGSLTTYNGVQSGESSGQSVRTSARVIKKMRQDTTQQQEGEVKVEAKIDKPEKENGISPPAVDCPAAAKQRMPKAFWTMNEKDLFFEALNEYGKDLDAITLYICNKVKKKGVPGTLTKNKHQVSHFYYRTWLMVSKHVQFKEDVKKVVQELYTLINYGEMRKRLSSPLIVKRTVHRLSELVENGVLAVRDSGKTVRIRTPVCRALRRLNRIEEWDEQLRLPARVAVMMCPRDMEAWSRIHAAAHNPRVMMPTAPSRRVAPILSFLQRRWLNPTDLIREMLLASAEGKSSETFNIKSCIKNGSSINISKPDDNVLEEKCKTTKLEDANAEETLDSVINIDDPSKLDELVLKLEESERNKKNSVEGDVLLKNVKRHVIDDSKDFVLHIGPKPGTDFNIPTVNVSENITSQRICYKMYKERSGQVNGSSNNKIGGGGRFKSHKRQRKDSGDAEVNSNKKIKPTADIFDKNDNFNVFDVDETANDGMNGAFAEIRSNSLPKDVMSDEKSNDENNFTDYREKDFFSEQEDEDKFNNETDGKSDLAVNKMNKDNIEISNKKHSKGTQLIKNKIKSKAKDREGTVIDADDRLITPLPGILNKNWNKDLLLQQVKKGWSIYDIGNLTIGDLYLMFGNESKLELNYWWASPTPPLPNIQNNTGNGILSVDVSTEAASVVNNIEEPKLSQKPKLSDHERLMLSPNHSNSMESFENEELKKVSDIDNSPDFKISRADDNVNLGTFNIVSKIINSAQVENIDKMNNGAEQAPANKPFVVAPRDKIVTLTTRLKKLLSLSQLQMAKGRIVCGCGHICNATKGKRTNSNDFTATSHMAEMGKISNKTSTKLKNNHVLLKDNVYNQNSLMKNISKPSHPQPTVILASKKEAVRKELANQMQEASIAKQQENIVQNPNVLDTADPTGNDNFISPYSHLKISPSVKEFPNSKIVDFSGLPKWRQRTVKKNNTKQPVVVRKLLPICPWPPINDSVDPSLVPVSVIPSTVTRLPQLKPAPPKKWANLAEKSKVNSTDDSIKILPVNSVNVEKAVSIQNNNCSPIVSETAEKPQENIFAITSDIVNSWNATNDRKDLIVDGSLLDISLPSNIVDDNSLEVPIMKLKGNDDTTAKNVDFPGLHCTESMSLSPSRLLKESENNWLGSDHDFSLSSFLGHLEGTPSLKSDDDAMKKSTSGDALEKNGGDMNSSCRGTNETVDNQIHCLMTEVSIDYVATFADLAAQVDSEQLK